MNGQGLQSLTRKRVSIMGLLSNVRKPSPKPTEPLWKGPVKDGITFSMLSRFLSCRERFRVYAIEGLRTEDTFNHRMEYGNMWHICEEYHAKGESWETRLEDYGHKLTEKYRLSAADIRKWIRVCMVQFPIYVQYWRDHRDMVEREPLLEEFTFDVPYQLPCGETVRLRGKFDSVDLIGKKGRQSVWLQENKTKGDINPIQIQRQLGFDLQTMLYMTALSIYCRDNPLLKDKRRKGGIPIEGVRYNVVRRPLSGGKGTIKQTKNESEDEYYQRLGAYITEEPHTYFMRWNSVITQQDIDVFRRRCLDPILQQVYQWYRWMEFDPQPFSCTLNRDPSASIHYQHPFGVRNILDEGGATDLDEYIMNGNTVGLRRVESLFTELT